MFALVSVYRKDGVVELARAFLEAGYTLLSTGGTYKTLTQAGLNAVSVAELTGSPEILDGRVKTLHPTIHAAILADRNNTQHTQQLEQMGIQPIGAVVCNLYPFTEVVAQDNCTLDEALENIDIGGVTMLRAAAKNHANVLVGSDIEDYATLMEALLGNADTPEVRQGLAAKAFKYTNEYDSAIATYLSSETSTGELPPSFANAARKGELRYGENPHQRAMLYAHGTGGVANAEQLHGIPPSYLNYLDADAAMRTLHNLSCQGAAVAIIKHASPCGVAVSIKQADAYKAALACDPVSAYGGVVAFNSTLDLATASAMKGTLYDVVVAPDYQPQALELLRTRKRTRVLKAVPAADPTPMVRSIGGGFLVQTPLSRSIDGDIVNTLDLSDPTMQDLLFAWDCCGSVLSNAIVVAKGLATVGIGGGQPNRVGSVEIALRSAGEQAKGAVLASDAFFPFADSVELAAEAGIAAIIQPGGSIRDNEVTAAAEKHGIKMVITGERRFAH